MTSMGAGTALRLAHTAVLAAVCVVVSGLGHDLSSGTSPSPWGYALALPPVCAAAWRLTRAERSATVVVGASAIGQVMLHALFSLANQRSTGGHAHGPAHTTRSDGPPAELPLHGAFDSSLLTSGMAGAHLLAGAVCGWWLWRGGRALVQLGRALELFAGRIGARLLLALAVLAGGCPALPAAPVPPGHRTPTRRPDSLALLRAVSRRGPPLLSS
ncbi:hypothetical protein [Streptomyces sp. NPDC020965]|uniref:hypothetical protein n=1 Tax=Streptomyces sp. NPDC020965 TaxID=3365105 RepID=UPI0037997709